MIFEKRAEERPKKKKKCGGCPALQLKSTDRWGGIITEKDVHVIWNTTRVFKRKGCLTSIRTVCCAVLHCTLIPLLDAKSSI